MEGAANRPLISVIIPTFNKRETLRKVLLALGQQPADSPSFEIVVVDDGSQDHTRDMVKEIQASLLVPLIYEWQGNRGVSASRNRAIGMARGEISLLLGDDVIAPPGLLKQHAAVHQRHGPDRIVAIGPVSWPQDLEVTPFMHWLDHGGPQFCYDDIRGREMVDFRYFYTCNASLSTDLLRRHPFRENIRYGFEDMELGLRLQDDGFRFVFNPDALGYHDHPRDLKQFSRRQYLAGQSLWVAHRENPKMEDFFPPPRYTLRQAFRTAIRALGSPIAARVGARSWMVRYWKERLHLAYSRGYRAASRDRL
jgi:glycosyltransferase involved in cell wall biosynthesis